MADEQTPGFTPGPWLSAEDYITAGSSTIARIFPGTGSEDANARLIASAPELLEALEQLADHGSFPSDIYDKAKAVIQKARGR